MRVNDIETIGAMQLELEHCATSYCGCPNTSAETMKEATRFVEDQFGHLCVPEIREAFRLAAAGKIEASLAAYHGTFSVRILGEVLAAYEDHRALTFRRVRAEQQAKQDAADNLERAAAMQEKFGTLGQQLAALQSKNDRYPTFEDVPYWFARKVVDEDLLELHLGEKAEVWIRAKHWAAAQVNNWLADPLLSKGDRKRYDDARLQIEADDECFPAELRPEAEQAYAKMLVFSHIAAYQEP